MGAVMEKVFVAKKVAAKLFATEAAVDTALVEASEFMSEMLKARQDVNASLVFADDCQVKLMDALKALSEARTAMVAVHEELNEAKLRLGIRTKMNGQDKPTFLAETDSVRTVAEAV
jgi:hypothetical protein